MTKIHIEIAFHVKYENKKWIEESGSIKRGGFLSICRDFFETRFVLQFHWKNTFSFWHFIEIAYAICFQLQYDMGKSTRILNLMIPLCKTERNDCKDFSE